MAAALASSKREITSTFIGFSLAPRLNAAGRMGNAAAAVELLLAEDEDTAAMLAQELCETNKLRQAEENKIVESALEKIEEEWDVHLKDGAVIVLADDNWQQGVIGIVASRITEKYGMPSILITFEGMPKLCDPSPHDIGKGSGRSVKGFNLVAALSECEDLLAKFGGHELEKCFTKDFNDILNDPAVSIVVECMGGTEPAFEYVSKSLMAGKSVVSSNKELVAAKGYELLEMAKENNVNFLFEASVGGGIPIIRPISQCLAANEIGECGKTHRSRHECYP